MALSYTKTVLLNEGTPEDKRGEVLRYFQETYTLYEKLFEGLKNDETYYERPERLRHPLIFYFGHTATFFINKLILAKIIDKRINPEFESMFAIGVDEMSWDDLNENNYNWPSIDEVREYRAKTKKLVEEVILNCEVTMPIGWEDPLWIVLMGIEHELIHLETSSVLFRQLPIEYVKPHGFWKICQEKGKHLQNELLYVEGGAVHLGRDKTNTHLYGWDNEFGRQEHQVDTFKASKYLVSNGEFLEFVQAGAYEDESYWEEEGARWRAFTKAQHPTFWVKQDDGTFSYRALFEEIEMPYDWPVDVNYHEAKAYCNFLSKRSAKNLRLPTEAEYYRLRDYCSVPDLCDWQKAPGNIDLEYYASASPVQTFEFEHGFYDVIGNVWQWSETPIDGFDGFEVHPVYDDFSTPTFDMKHNLIKGGSWISKGNEATKFSRYAFRKHFYQHAGFRYVESEEEVTLSENIYEKDMSVSQYCEAQFGAEYFGVKNFSKQMAEFALDVMKERAKTRALDLGCAIGRASFELAKEFDFVNGIDFSARFIKNAIALQELGTLSFKVPTEGELYEVKSISLKDFALDETAKKVEFFQGDACNLKGLFSSYDLILANNLIDRLYNPKKFLEEVHEKLNAKGILILASPYTWLEEFTNKEEWLGGYKKNGKEVSTFETVQSILSKEFTLVQEPQEFAFVIRETKRKFQHTLSHVSVWEKK